MNYLILKDGSYAQGYFVPEGAIIVPTPKPTRKHSWDKNKKEWVFDGFTDEEAMDLLRMERNKILSQSDWMSNSDVVMSEEWKIYRQQLRDLTKSSSPKVDENGQLTNVTWPTKPE